ncbi:glycoside hydrolase family 108 protein [candidate division KSB1 bacterium]|nr:glycoside hydrolase family 108 protein [candidate division KSB1 bacterium]
MKENREIVQKRIGLSEGGFVNNPKDPGGATDRGITQKTFDAWNRVKKLPLRSVKGISKDVAEEIIFENYMRPVKFDDLPAGLDYAMADYSVNSGPARANKELQRLIGVSADGIFGNITLSKVQQIAQEPGGIHDLIEGLCAARMAFLRGLPHWPEFKNGWTDRVQTVQEAALKMAAGVQCAAQPAAGFISAKAPEPAAPVSAAADPASVGAVISGGGVLAAVGAVIGSLAQLHPVAQSVAMAGLLVAGVGIAFVLRKRILAIATGGL